MSENRTLNYGDRLPESWVKQIQELIGSYVSPNFTITQPSTTTVKVPASTDNNQVGLTLSGRWRYNTSDATASHPGGAAGAYDLYATGSDNSFSGGEPETDSTVYAFGLAIRALASPPATALYRKIASITWDGSQITSVIPLVGNGATGGCPMGVGWVFDYEGSEASAPSWAVPADGRYLDNATYAAHYAKVGSTYNNMGGLANPPAGKHRVLDARGRVTVGKGDMGSGNGTTPAATGARVQRAGITTLGTVTGEEYHTLLTAEMPSHSHSGSTGAEAAHVHTGTTSAGSAHSHAVGTLAFTGSSVTSGAGSSHSHAVGTLAFTGSAVTSGGQSVDHTHSGTTSGASVDHSHFVSLTSSGVSANHHHELGQSYYFDYGVSNYGLASPGQPNDGGTSTGQDITTNQSADHSHTVNGSSGGESADHSHTYSSSGVSAGHTHSVTAAGTIGGSTAAEAAHTHSVTAAGTIGGSTATEAAHTHTFTTGGGSSHLHSISAEGGGGSHENVPPVAVVNKMVSVF